MIPVLLTLLAADWSASVDRAIPDPNVNYLAIDLRTRETVAVRWPDADKPIPVGSLVKPFTSLAWAGEYPAFECKGAAGACWRAQPHGRLRFADALAQSCNAYFLQLAGGVKPGALHSVTAAFQLPDPSAFTPEALIGLGDSWRIPPAALLRAYADLAARRGDPRVDPVLAGLQMAARNGTAQGAGKNVLAKTGTAPCVAEKRHAGDGFALILSPAESPRLAILVRVHDVPGALAARTANRLLTILQNSR